jgi:hypothetical protein
VLPVLAVPTSLPATRKRRVLSGSGLPTPFDVSVALRGTVSPMAPRLPFEDSSVTIRIWRPWESPAFL